MKKILLTTICLAFATFSFSQQLSRYVVSSGGNYSTNGGYSNSSTIGETMVTTLTSASNSLTQGFQQSFSNSVDPTITIINPLNGDVFPNNNNIGIDFAITDFVVAAGTGDGHIHYYVNGAMTMKYDTLPITLNGLTNGSHQIIIELVDNSHQGFSPTIADTVNFSVNVISGCTDATATNYNPLAAVDDGSCTYIVCNAYPTGLNVFDVIDTRVNFAWDNMNITNCLVLKYYVRYREVGTSAWNTRAAGVGNGLCNFGLNTTSQMLLGLTASTTYEWKLKAFYCGGSSSNYSPVSTFTTADACPILANLAVQTFTGNHTKANFTWDSTGTYTYARVALRVDTVGSAWQTVGGFGTFAPTLSQVKFGLVAGESYRAGARAYCNANISSHRSWWTPFIFWTQPGTAIKLDGGTAINNLDVYPNPSRDLFNVSFTSEDTQDLEVRVINVVGEVVYTESLSQFIGEYTKQVDLATYTKGVYFLEITTNNGVINKKLILQ